jgi:hypothetical protein
MLLSTKYSRLEIKKQRCVPLDNNTRYSFKFLLKVGAEKSIVNARTIYLNLTSLFALFGFLVLYFSLQTDEWCIHNRLFNVNFDEKFK